MNYQRWQRPVTGFITGLFFGISSLFLFPSAALAASLYQPVMLAASPAEVVESAQEAAQSKLDDMTDAVSKPGLQDQAEGTVKESIGKAKVQAGKLNDNPKQQLEGLSEQAQGRAQRNLGKTKQSASQAQQQVEETAEQMSEKAEDLTEGWMSKFQNLFQ